MRCGGGSIDDLLRNPVQREGDTHRDHDPAIERCAQRQAKLQGDADRSHPRQIRDADRPHQTAPGVPHPDGASEPRARQQEEQVAQQQAGDVDDHGSATLPR